MKIKNPHFKTIAYAGEAEFLKSLTDQLDELGTLIKNEEGSQTDPDGHVISYSAVINRSGDTQDLFWAMINSDQKHYLIRADKNLFEEV